VLNEYAQAAYLASDDLVGLGEVHRRGMDFWETLKTRGEGIDPVPATSLSLYYPNTTDICGTAGSEPWSCASSSGEIWLVPEHVRGGMLNHELGHQLQFNYVGACTTKNLNEMWVAGAFWDFYDTRPDGQDTLYYIHTGLVPKVYLGHGWHNVMPEYIPIFKSKANANHQTLVGEIFTQNRQ
jgi:hypothetical protein